MQVRAPESVRRAIVDHAREGGDLEVCGFLVGQLGEDAVDVSRSVRASNVAAEGQAERFTVDPREILRLQEELDQSGEELVGVYHSHPEGRAQPSALDLRNARLWPSMLHAIVGLGGPPPAELRFYWSASERSSLVLCSAPP